MKELKEKLKVELEKARKLSSTNDKFYHPYTYGIQFAINLIEELMSNEKK
jgi:hypothetical protein